MTAAPDRCLHSFPDPYPQPIDQPGDCRGCGITYQEAKAAMTSPSDELRAAVTRLRTLIADPELTPGPWLSMDRGDRVLWDGEGAHDQPPVYVVDEPMSNGANAAWIAALGPNVGRALADWLDAMATWAREYPEMAHDHDRPACDDYACDAMGRGIAVARTINGGEQR